jgi:hypothetical protein
MIALQQVLHDVQGSLLVRVELGIFVGKERFGVGDADDRLLCEAWTGNGCERRNHE